MKNRVIILLILVVIVPQVFAQEATRLARSEKIYLHTDRNIYVAGDNLFYSLYLKGNQGQMSKYAYLILRDHNNMAATEIRLEICNQTAFGHIPLSDTLKSGIYQIVCYTNCMRNGIEDSYFKKEILIHNRFDETLEIFSESDISLSDSTLLKQLPEENRNENVSIVLDKKVFKPREKISFSIVPNIISENPAALISVSVGEVTPGIPAEPDISDYFKNSKLTTATTETEKSTCTYFSEIYGDIIQGRLIVLPGSTVLADSAVSDFPEKFMKHTLMVSTPDSIVNMQYVTTDSAGRFSFLLNRFYDGKELIIRLKENMNAAILTDDKFSLREHFIPSGSLYVKGIKARLIRNGEIAQIKRIYKVQTEILTERIFEAGNTIPRIYYSQFELIYPSDYLLFNDFVEISREILPSFKIRKNRDSYISDYPAIPDQLKGGSGPSIFLDGVPIDDVNQIISLRSEQIKKIESLPAIRIYGEMSFAGILAVFSRDNRISNIQFKTPSVKFQALSSQPYSRPFNIERTNSNTHIPDLRQLLLWDPQIVLENNDVKEINCYASDLEGKFRINIQGIASDGKTLNSSAIITVKK